MNLRHLMIGALTLGSSFIALAQNPAPAPAAPTAESTVVTGENKKEFKAPANPGNLDALITLRLILEEKSVHTAKLDVYLDGKLDSAVNVTKDQTLYSVEVKGTFKTLAVKSRDGLAINVSWVGIQFVKAFSDAEKLNIRGRTVLDMMYANRFINAKEKVVISDLRIGFLSLEAKLDEKGGFTSRATDQLYQLYKQLNSKENEALFASLETREGLEDLVVQIRSVREDIRARVVDQIIKDLESKTTSTPVPQGPAPKPVVEVGKH